MRSFFWIFACLFCFASTPVVAAYGCVDDDCIEEPTHSSSDSKATACQHSCCCANVADTLSAIVIKKPPFSRSIIPVGHVYLKPAHIVGPLMEPPAA